MPECSFQSLKTTPDLPRHVTDNLGVIGAQMSNPDLPLERAARVHMLQEGYSYVLDGYPYRAQGDAHVAPSIGLILDGDAAIVVDPGLVADRDTLIDAVSTAGIDPVDVTDVVFSHHHPDHTVNAALFPAAQIHDHWAIYSRDVWHAREVDGFLVSPSVRLIRTPGHTAEDITTLVGTADDVLAFTHAWATDEPTSDDRSTPDPSFLHASRRRILASATIVVPGHGPAFRPTVD
jgi:glyoxylase-like metal-dependent hydrolase (beta-lactamase superfamily II)